VPKLMNCDLTVHNARENRQTCTWYEFTH